MRGLMKLKIVGKIEKIRFDKRNTNNVTAKKQRQAKLNLNEMIWRGSELA